MAAGIFYLLPGKQPLWLVNTGPVPSQVLGTHKHTNLEGKDKKSSFFPVKHKHWTQLHRARLANCASAETEQLQHPGTTMDVSLEMLTKISKSLIFRRQKTDVSNWATMEGKLHKSQF